MSTKQWWDQNACSCLGIPKGCYVLSRGNILQLETSTFAIFRIGDSLTTTFFQLLSIGYERPVQFVCTNQVFSMSIFHMEKCSEKSAHCSVV